jgi:hypothetical protein
MKFVLSSVDGQLIFTTVLGLIPNLFLILWAVARLAREARLTKAKLDMIENDIGLLDQSISSLTSEFQAIRKIENEANAASAKATAAKAADHPK